MRSADDPTTADAELVNKARRLLTMALEPTRTFAGYQLLGRIGVGATSVVHRARRGDDGPVVALKVMRDADAATDAELRRFRNGAAAAEALDHPNIVRVLEVGEHEGVPYLVLTLIEGESLRQVLRRRRPDPLEATRWMVAIARAVQYAHGEDVLHRDLKPANILIDAAGEPHVADFGLARRLDQEVTGDPEEIMGTLAYMAPEQASRHATPTTFAADIYSLGVTLYELLTGKVPFPSGSLEELTWKLRHADPPPPRSLNPAVSASLENVCLRCLEKDPARRYRSAASLADDLESVLRGAPTAARAPSLWRRAVRWAQRHPRGMRAVVAALPVVVVGAALVLASWRARGREEARVLDTNAFIATGQAGAVLFQLREYADRLERGARHPEVMALLERGELVDRAPQLTRLVPGFDTVFLEANDGRLLAQGPDPVPHILGRSYEFRDYFRGARQLGEAGAPGVYVARAFRSESYDRLEFALSTPVMRGRTQLGILAATFNAGAAFGAVRMQEQLTGDVRITTALLGPRSNDRGARPYSPFDADFTFLVHPRLRRGAEHALRVPTPAQLRAAFGPPAPPGEQFALQYLPPLEISDYRDPIPGFEGPSLAAFAPVGKTGFVVLVETPKAAILPGPALLLRQSAVSGGIALGLALLAASAIATSLRRRTRAGQG